MGRTHNADLHAFSPRLTGAVLDGSADWRSPLEIHLFADCCEDVLLELMGQHVRWNNEDRLVVYPDGAHERRPLFRIQHGDMEVELICFPARELKNRVPLNPLDGRPMRRARLAELEKELRES